MEPIRIGRYCNPIQVWATEADNGTYWHGTETSFLKLIRHQLPPIEIVTNYPKANWTIPHIHAINQGLIDMDPDFFGVNWRRFQTVDFSAPLYYDGIVILSSNNMKTDVIKGVFDYYSYVAFATCLLLLSVVLFTLDESRQPLDLIRWLLKVTGMYLRQFSTLRMGQHQLKGVIKLIAITSFFIASMYNAIVISVLSSGRNVQNIDTLEQLANKFVDMKIYVNKGTVPHEILEQSMFYHKLKDRMIILPVIEDADTTETIYRDVAIGTHVFLDFRHNTVNDYDKIVSADFLCQVSFDMIRISKDPLMTVPVAWIFKKNFTYAEVINRALAWLDAYGVLYNTHTRLGWILDEKNQKGIFSPHKLASPCPQLPENKRGHTRRMCRRHGQQLSGDIVRPLSQFHMQSLWLIFGCGISLALVVFLIELLIIICKWGN